ncbi:MAG: 50S ribosomal protein L11 methyltransferase [Syntrophothermus sp.]|uniref:50S ribosomal protein L11 methyltransferase n=1 Tax=Syntrophothermus sp. TaxID=2736299 RepID=UPI00257A6451|nr:50S ribosomal protein L11 methyltransferase [Syntrophothermus sp.]NSW83274.1 50S ribosomal protein L11 methyltransferase [Syntrophothermus sp.]
MNWKEIRVMTDEACGEAIAGLFHELGCGGVVIEDPYLARRKIESGDWDAYELPLEFINRDFIVIKAYFPEDRHITSRLIEGLERIEKCFGFECRFLVEDVNEEDWANCWKSYYHSLKIGKRLVIKPSWEDYRAEPGEVVIEIDPGMAFGTGTHATTRFCLELIEKYVSKDMTLIDIGTGSGILAIAAAKLGARRIIALDLDPVAVQVAKENVARNGVEEQVEVWNLDFREMPETRADLIIGNLTAELVKELMPKIRTMLVRGGHFIASGITAIQWPLVEAAMESAGFTVQELTENEEEWVAVVVQKGW